MTKRNFNPNLHWHPQRVTRVMRELRNGHRSALVWMTGLPSSGKSTLAHGLEEQLFQQHRFAYVLDGDNIRHGLCGDLGFEDQDRAENIRRIGEVANLFLDAGIIVLAAFISPFTTDRLRVRELVGTERFIEVYCRCPIEVCEARDEKGNYTKAQTGAIANFTGISSPYEIPIMPDLVLDTDRISVEHSIAAVLSLLYQRGIIIKNDNGNAI